MAEALTSQTIALPSGELEILQPQESAELPDAAGVEWAPIAPYWSVLWRSGVALAAECDSAPLRGQRIVELGCGLGAPSLAAARAGATVLATDCCPEALALLARNATRNDLAIETAAVDWAQPDALLAAAPFDLVLAADVLYDPAGVEPLLSLLPQLAPRVWLADPGRDPAAAFFEGAARCWDIASAGRGVVTIQRLERRRR